MKFQNWTSFKKNIENSFPSKLSSIYLVISPDDFERCKIIDFILSYLPRIGSSSIDRFSATETNVKDIIFEMDSPSLLGGASIKVLDEIETYKIKDSKQLVAYIKNQRIFGFLILAAKSKKSLLTLLSEVDNKGVVLDLASEKPWEKEKRLALFIKEKCAQSKKIISSHAAEFLLSYVGVDMARIENEIDKIALYIGEKNEISKEDILKISSFVNNYTVWQLAEEIVWGKDPFKVDLEKGCTIDSDFFHSFLVALRYNLQEGLKLASAVENFMDVKALFSKVRTSVLQKRIIFVKEVRSSYFKKALIYLFEIESLSKSGIALYGTLIDQFRGKMLRHLDFISN